MEIGKIVTISDFCHKVLVIISDKDCTETPSPFPDSATVYQTDLHMICNVAGGLERDGHAGHAVAVAKLEGVVDGAEEHPREEADVGHAVEEFSRALGRSVAWRVEQPRQVPVHRPANRDRNVKGIYVGTRFSKRSISRLCYPASRPPMAAGAG